MTLLVTLASYILEVSHSHTCHASHMFLRMTTATSAKQDYIIAEDKKCT